MAQDLLQIGLEHHRAGRVGQAEAAYRAVLAERPNDAEALHWLGVLLTQAGQAAEATPLLERAVTLKPDDAAYHHNLGQARLMSGQVGEAIAALTEAAALQGDRAETFLALARAYALRRSRADGQAAVAALQRAREQGIDSAELYHDLGVAYLACDRPADAIGALAEAIKRKSDYPAAALQTAMAHRAHGDRTAARNWANKALEMDRDYAQAWHVLGLIDEAVGNNDLAIGHFRRAIRCRPQFLSPYRSMEGVLRRLGRDAEADVIAKARDALELSSVVAEALGKPVEGDNTTALAATLAGGPSPAVAELESRVQLDAGRARLHEALSAMAGLLSPDRTTPAAMVKLFDQYAPRFDQHLRQKLSYAGPELVLDALSRAGVNRQPGDTADLGCGTGLCGPLLRPLSKTLVGVDLSPAMLARAADRAAYDRLENADLVEFLQRSENAYDLLVAADVMIYLGDLTPVFEAAWKSLRPGGAFAATFEAAPQGDRYVRDKRTRRFMHTKAYLERLATIFGFNTRSFEAATLRVEVHQPVKAWVVVLQKPA